MTEQAPNPLRGYFREPGLATEIPSRGHFYEDGEVEFTARHEVDVCPMTANDELILKNPDALLSGDAMVRVIGSCCPGIQDPRNLLMDDFDALMLAIRAASYGDAMDFEPVCPSCGEKNETSVSINYILSTMKFHDREYIVRLSDDVSVHLRPYSYRVSNTTSLLAFEQSKYLEAVKNDDLTEDEKQKIFGETFANVADINKRLVMDSIIGVEIPNGLVQDDDHISEWLENAPVGWIKEIEKRIQEVNDKGIAKTQKIICRGCEHEWETQIGYDPSHFFG